MDFIAKCWMRFAVMRAVFLCFIAYFEPKKREKTRKNKKNEKKCKKICTYQKFVVILHQI